MKNELVDIIYQSLKFTCNHVDKFPETMLIKFGDIRIADVSLDGDHNSSEVIITLDDGDHKKDFVISNNDIREIGGTIRCDTSSFMPNATES